MADSSKDNQFINKLNEYNDFKIFDEKNYINKYFNTNYQTFKNKIIEKEEYEYYSNLILNFSDV